MNKHTISKICSTTLSVFLVIMLILPQGLYAQSVANLPAPGVMLYPSPSFVPPIVNGMIIDPEKPFHFDFIIDRGDDNLQGDAFQKEANKLIKYFMTSLTVPDEEMWVNLSPYEKDRIIADGLGDTEMGRDMLAQDYMLKQLTASLMHPDEELGNEFWKRVYTKTQAKFGTTKIPTNTFNKIWIVPRDAVVYANGTKIFVIESHLDVMLEQDYLALEMNKESTKHGVGDVATEELDAITGIAKQMVREVLIPEIEKEVNQGKTFANLRQIYNSMILATWYKEHLISGAFGQLYINKNKVNGVDVEDKNIKHKIYEQYVAAFEKGVFNFIREDYDPSTQEIIPRKYFSGGLENVDNTKSGKPDSNWIEENSQREQAIVGVDMAMLGIVGAQSQDSVGSDSWRNYRNADNLMSVWSPPADSPFGKFFKPKMIDNSDKVSESIVPRYSDGEVNSEKGIENLIQEQDLGSDTAIVLNSGGPHSIAMAVKLMEIGYQPVFMIDAVASETSGYSQRYATLLYFSEYVSRLKVEGRFTKGSPPVFIMDAHRNRGEGEHSYGLEDLPSREELVEFGITRVIYLNEGDQNGTINQSYQSTDRLADSHDIKLVVARWQEGDTPIQMLYTGVKPWLREAGGSLESFNFRLPAFDTYSRAQLSYPDKEVEVESDSLITYHRNRIRYFFRIESNELDAINETGYGVDGDMESFKTAMLSSTDQEVKRILQEKGIKSEADFASSPVGGIDFNPKGLNLTTTGEMVPFEMPSFTQETLDSMNVTGYMPIIINVTPVTNFTLLLGLSDDKESESQQLSRLQ